MSKIQKLLNLETEQLGIVVDTRRPKQGKKNKKKNTFKNKSKGKENKDNNNQNNKNMGASQPEPGRDTGPV